MNLRRLCLLMALLLAVLAACNGNDEDDAADEDVDPQELLNEAAAKLTDIGSFEFVLSASGAPVTLRGADLGQETDVIFQRAEGFFVAEDRMQADVELALTDSFTIQPVLVAIGDDQFYRLESLPWQATTLAPGFNPEDFVSEDQGLANALRSIEQIEYLGIEELDGIDVHHITGVVDAELVTTLTVGLIGTREGQIDVDVFIRTRDQQVEQMVMQEPINPNIDPDKPTVWRIGLYNYNGDLSIEVPEVN